MSGHNKTTFPSTLILHASAGSGHKKAAEAIFKASQNSGFKTEILDIVSFMPPAAQRLYTDGYSTLITRWPGVWGALYFLAGTPLLSFFNVHVGRFFNAVLCKRLVTLLLEKKPDIVISTQFLASEIVSYAKEKYALKTRLVTVITDFGVHHCWLAPGTDLYCVASNATKKILESKEIPPEKIMVTGIPLDEKFLRRLDKNACREKLGLQKDKFTALVVTGGIGAGPIETIVEMLRDEIQLLVVCGYNEELFTRLSSKNTTGVKTFRFIDNIEELMVSSDLVITKAGGLTVTESLAMGLPMLFFLLIPGQEENNAKLIQKEGAGHITRSLGELKNRVLDLKNNPQKLLVFKNKCRELAKPDSCRLILAAALGEPMP